ncbi:MAG: VOC family protein [Isosphaeraceae bacterium]
MRLNHLDLTVPNVAQSRAFFETYLGFRCIVSVSRDDDFAVLTDEAGFALTLNNLDKARPVEYPGGFHIGFMQDSPERVDQFHQRLISDGFDVESPRLDHGAWTFSSARLADSSSRSGISSCAGTTGGAFARRPWKTRWACRRYQ